MIPTESWPENYPEEDADDDALEYIRKTYGVPAFKWKKISFRSNEKKKTIPGMIIGGRAGYLIVRLEGREDPAHLHPTWNVLYEEDEDAVLLQQLAENYSDPDNPEHTLIRARLKLAADRLKRYSRE